MPGLTALIPLDGTELSESAFDLLPFAKTLGVTKARLISAWESAWGEGQAPAGRPAGESEELAQKGRALLSAYLEKQAQRVRDLGLEVETIIKVGRAAESVIQTATEDTDLILIATHGRTGIERWRLGSVADRIIRESACPALVIGPNVTVQLSPYTIKRVLIPLDGTGLSELALPLALRIAELTGAELDLTRVVTTPTMAVDPGMGVYPMDLLTAIEDAAKAYLAEKAAALGSKYRVTTAMHLGSPGETLLAHLREKPSELVVVASHGRAGVARAALGSVADRLLHGPAPVLVFRPGDGVKGRLLEGAAG